MDKYALMKMFNHDRRLQSYMYVVISVDPETIIVEDYFPTTNKFVEKYKKFSTPVPVPKYWLGFSFISSEYYELDMNFYESELKGNQTKHPMIKSSYFS